MKISGGCKGKEILADVNGDGKLDAVASDADGTVRMLLGNGDGTFQAGKSYAITGGSWQVSAGDVNGDGKTDLVTADYSTGKISVLIGNGDGSFAAAKSYAIGAGASGPHGLVIGDLNGDGKIDVVTADYTTKDLSIILGNGDGTFLAGSTIATGTTRPIGVTVADLQGDGKLDVVASGYATAKVFVYLGNGNGTFKAGTSYTPAGGPKDNLVADFTGDGVLDIVTADSSGVVSLLTGNGDGTFNAAVSIAAAGTQPYGVATGDFNGDSVADIVTGGFLAQMDVILGAAKETPDIQALNLTTQAGAQTAMTTISGTLDRIETQLSTIGAFQSRLSVAANLLQVQREDYLAAASRITDVDVASETAELARTQILQQAATAVLATANSQPDIALKLLR